MAPVPARGLVLGFGGIRPAELEAGVAVLAEVLERQLRRRSGVGAICAADRQHVPGVVSAEWLLAVPLSRRLPTYVTATDNHLISFMKQFPNAAALASAHARHVRHG